MVTVFSILLEEVERFSKMMGLLFVDSPNFHPSKMFGEKLILKNGTGIIHSNIVFSSLP